MSDLERVSKLAQLLEEQERAVEEAEAELKRRKQAFDQTRMEDLPELMSEVGLSALTLESGAQVEVAEEVSCSITKARKDRALAWLRENGFGGIIKTMVGAAFPPSDREEAERLAAEWGEDYPVAIEESVHTATLKSFVKERLREGDDIPFDLFSIHPYNVAKLKRGK